jgi:hypothetical protein
MRAEGITPKDLPALDTPILNDSETINFRYSDRKAHCLNFPLYHTLCGITKYGGKDGFGGGLSIIKILNILTQLLLTSELLIIPLFNGHGL